jgi:hypothetical protein
MSILSHIVELGYLNADDVSILRTFISEMKKTAEDSQDGTGIRPNR